MGRAPTVSSVTSGSPLAALPPLPLLPEDPESSSPPHADSARAAEAASASSAFLELTTVPFSEPGAGGVRRHGWNAGRGGRGGAPERRETRDLLTVEDLEEFGVDAVGDLPALVDEGAEHLDGRGPGPDHLVGVPTRRDAAQCLDAGP